MSVPPSTRVLVSKGGCEKAAIVSEGAAGDIANHIVLGEHRAVEEVEECLVVGVKRHGSERGRCGTRLAPHHCVRRATVVEVHPGELVCSVIGAFRVSVRGRSEANADPPRPERLDITSPIRPGLGGCFRVRRGVVASVRGAELRRRMRYCLILI